MANKYWEDRQNQRKPINKSSKDFTDFENDFLLKLAWQTYRELKLTISEGIRSGKTYKRGDKIHIASAPGEPPVTDSGKLVNSIGTPKKDNNSYIIPINSQYAMYLETGTIKMQPRPYIKRSMKKAWDELNKK